MSPTRCLLVFLALASAMTACGAAWAQNGVLGIYADRQGDACSATLGTGRATTLYVVFLPRGGTMSGITGAEFRIETASASGYLFQDERVIDAAFLYLGTALGSGANVAFAECDSRTAIPLLRFQVYNSSGAANARLRVAHKNPPTSPTFPCPLAVMCDDKNFALVCVEAGEFVLNPSGSVTCAGGAADSEWSRVKELYR